MQEILSGLHYETESKFFNSLLKIAIDRDNNLILITNSIHILNALSIAVLKGIVKPEECNIINLTRNEARVINIDSRGMYYNAPKGFNDKVADDCMEIMRLDMKNRKLQKNNNLNLNNKE